MINNYIAPVSSIDILLVEDNPGDVFLITSSLRESKMPISLSHVENGEKAIAFLRQQGDYTNAPRPQLIILDLNLPVKNGFEVLEDIKNDEELKAIPVIILTSSQTERDILNSYKLYANSYVTKPFELNDFAETVHSLDRFWLSSAKLPTF